MSQEIKTTKIIKTSMAGPFEDHIWKYELQLPEWLSRWDVYDYWEQERIFSIEKELKRGDILFDVGVESGWLSALFAKYIVGGENMVLFEPSDKYWPTIKQIWEANNLSLPKGCYQGFIGAENRKIKGKIYKKVNGWPASVEGIQIGSGMPYAYIHNDSDKKRIPTIMLDRWSEKYDVLPDGVTIDVEGAEMGVLRGMSHILMTKKPLVWVSIHPDLMLKNYGVSDKGLYMWMEKLGYKYEILATDHETHVYFYPKAA